jgi:hypothetical protein
MQIKTTLRFYVLPVRIATITNTNNNKYWQGCGEKGTINAITMENSMETPQKTKNRTSI